MTPRRVPVIYVPRAAERALIESVLDMSSDAIAATDEAGRCWYWNEAMARATGLRGELVLGRLLRELVEPADNDLPDAIVARVLAGETVPVDGAASVVPGLPLAGQFVGQHKPIRSHDGRVTGVLTMLRDVSAERRTNHRLLESEARFEGLADSSPVLLWMSREDSLCTFFNQSWLDFTGRTQQEEWGIGWAEGVHFADLQRALDTYADAFDQRVAFEMEYRLRRHDGEFRWLLDRGVPRYDAGGVFLGYIGSCVDITERKRASQELAASEERIRAILSSAPDSILSIDAEGLIATFSPSAERAFGYPLAEVVGRPLSELVDERIVRAMQGEATSPSLEGLGRDRHGRTFPIEATFSPVTATHSRTLVIRDVSERRSLERQVLENDEQVQMRIGQDLHDGLGQLLTGIALLAKGLEGTQPERELPRAERLTELINDAIAQVKGLAKGLCPVHLESNNLHEVMSELVADSRDLLMIDCQLVATDDVDSDSLNTRTQLYLIAREAITNAVRHGAAKTVTVQLARQGGRRVLMIEDDGPGFDPNEVDKGLGLRSMEYRARMIGGLLTFSRCPEGGGTRVRCEW